MLTKLMKYEFKATGRTFLPVFAALLITSGISRLFIALNLLVSSIIGIGVSIILMIGIFLLLYIQNIQRFRQYFLPDEGILMMTLPVKTDSLILSKLLVTAAWVVSSLLVVTLSILILDAGGALLRRISDFFQYLGWATDWHVRAFSITPFQAVAYMLWLVVGIILVLLSSALLPYACIALSLLVNKQRGVFSIASLIAINSIIHIFAVILMSLIIELDAGSLSGNIFFSMSYLLRSPQLILLLIPAIPAALSVIYYSLTRYMLKNRLNL